MCEHFHRQPEATICLAALDHPKVSDSRAAATALVGAVQGIAVQGLLQAPERSIDELAKGFIGLLAEW
jgi:hypothetical protein